MFRRVSSAIAMIAVTACHASPVAASKDSTQLLSVKALAAPAPGTTELTRIDCGLIRVKNFTESFSDRHIYPSGPKVLTDSCYLIEHNGKHMLWDTGLSAGLKGKSQDWGDMVVSITATIPEQLAQVGLHPSDIDIVGISHRHDDHTGQAALFPNARLIIGKPDFEIRTDTKDDPLAPWHRSEAKVTLMTGDYDVFGDGSVIALDLPGHTGGHHGLLVKATTGWVLLSGDLYHAKIARQMRGVPPFNTNREQTLHSMDRFEQLAHRLNANVIIQHEPGDVPRVEPLRPRMRR